MTVTPDQREAWQALADAATEGPWDADSRTGAVCTRPPHRWPRVVDGATEADAEFIAAARTAVPALLAALRDAEAERDEARAFASAWKECARVHIEGEHFAVQHIDAWRRKLSKLSALHNRVVTEQSSEYDRRITRVRALHYATSWPDVGTLCEACDHSWPCPTIRAMDGTETKETP